MLTRSNKLLRVLSHILVAKSLDGQDLIHGEHMKGEWSSYLCVNHQDSTPEGNGRHRECVRDQVRSDSAGR